MTIPDTSVLLSILAAGLLMALFSFGGAVLFIASTRMLERLIGEDIVFTRELGAAGGLLRVDPGQVEQVLLNLLVNGRDAMPEGGTLNVRTRCRQVVEEEPLPGGSIAPGTAVATITKFAACAALASIPADRRGVQTCFRECIATKIGSGIKS